MKNKIVLAMACCLPLHVSAQLLISEYVEGGGYNKAVELFNPTTGSIDLSDYQLKVYYNGKTSVGNTISLSGSVDSGKTYVIANTGISSSAHVDFKTGSLKHNGDDAIALYRGAELIDIIGEIGTDPGSQWGSGLESTKDNTIVRHSPISAGSAAFEISSQWQGFAKDTLTGLGDHSFTGEYLDVDGGGNNGGGNNGGGSNGGNSEQCGETFTSIAAIQGSGFATTMPGSSVWVEGVVTADFQATGYRGFYIQSTDAEKDENANSSEALFVYDATNAVNVGERVRIQATAGEFNDQTQLSNVQQLTVCSSNQALPAAQPLTLPLSDNQKEAVEGMRITFTQPLYVTDTYNYGRYGQLGLASERLMTPTQVVTPGEAAQQLAAENAAKVIWLDDVETSQNPESLPYPAPALSGTNSIRSGDKVVNVDAVLAYAYGKYQLMPTSPLTIEKANDRTSAPVKPESANVTVASYNVLNYFNGNGQGAGFPTPRGAHNANEFDRQRTKIIAAIAALDADIVGLMEIENDGYGQFSAITDLVNGLNATVGSTQYSALNPSVAQIGDDDITVGIIYRHQAVTPVGNAKILDSNNSVTDEQGPLFLDSKNRPMLAQKFTRVGQSDAFVVAINHLKSKGSNCNSLNDPDLGDGQGNCNQTRTRAANAIGQFITQQYADTPVLILGDLNAYAKEDPITMLASQGFDSILPNESYSYIYGGQLGQLDHALANTQMQAVIEAAHVWHINADEPRVLDYNTENKSASQQANFFSPDAYRSSDHDPIIVHLTLGAQQALLGDFDQDQDVDKSDVTIFNNMIIAGEQIDSAYDFNNDNKVDRRDVRGLMALCTRSRCATE